MGGVAVSNMFFENQDLNGLFSGVLVLIFLVTAEQLLNTILFRRPKNLAMSDANRREIYDRIFHARDLRALLRGTEWGAAELEADHLCLRKVRYRRLAVPLLARTVVLGLDLLLIYYAGTSTVVVADPLAVPTRAVLGPANGQVRDGCVDQVGDIRSCTLKGHAIACGLKVVNETREWERHDNLTVTLTREYGTNGHYLFVHGPLSVSSFQDLSGVMEDGQFDGLAVVAEYVSYDRVTNELLVFDSLPRHARDTGIELEHEFITNFELLHELLERVAQRTGVQILQNFIRLAPRGPRARVHQAVISSPDRPRMVIEAFYEVVRDEMTLVPQSQFPIVLRQDGTYGEVEGRGVYVLEKNRLDNSVFVGVIVCMLIANGVLMKYMRESVALIAYRAAVETVGGDNEASPTGHAHDEKAFVPKNYATGNVGRIAYARSSSGQELVSSFSGCVDVK